MNLHDLIFGLALALLLTHELDAVQREEWRLLPLLRRLPERYGQAGFIVVHVPLFWLILLAWRTGDSLFVAGVSLFCIIHLGLHLWLRQHPRYQFRGWLSWGLIGGAALCGALALGMR